MTATAGVRCMLMRGGTSKGAYFLARDLPQPREQRDDLLLRMMGSGDPRQIDGIGGAHPLTSKVAVVSRSGGPDADLDYLFLQLGVEEATVSDQQNCGNLLPTGNLCDHIDGIEVTCVDNGMPVVLARAADLGITGYEPYEELAGDEDLPDRVQALRCPAGKLMGLGDVTGAISVVTALAIPGAAGAELAAPPAGIRYDVEHASGHLEVEAEIDTSGKIPHVRRCGVVRTARKLFDGTVFPCSSDKAGAADGITAA
jgi:4-oxalomesaconate tautomerase